MAENSKIEWTDHTFNPWIGCTKVSPACDHCYAEAWAKRFPTTQPQWGAGQPRRQTSEANWKKPLAWDRRCEKAGIRERVFCASLADVFDAEVPDAWRDKLFVLIASTPNLDWLLLTKRPKVAREYIGGLPERRKGLDCHSGLDNAEWPLPNVWLGVTVEDQKMADARIPLLLDTPAALRFISYEPALGPVDFTRWIEQSYGAVITPMLRGNVPFTPMPRLDWIIAGGESGPHARPAHPDWFRSVRDQCAAAGTAFLFKQWGEWVTEDQSPEDITLPGEARCPWVTVNEEGEYLGDQTAVYNVGKKAAGRALDDVMHDDVPGAANG